MKRLLIVMLTVWLTQMNLVAQMTPATPVAGAGILFRELSFSEALKVAKEENKLLFMDCYTTWCGPCKMLSNVVFKDSLFADYFNRNFVNLKMDMEKGEGPELAKKYKVRAYPTLLFLNSDGEVVHELVGADKAPALLKNVKMGVEAGGISAIRKRYEGGERDSAFVFSYIDVLSAANQNAEAEKVVTEFLTGREKKIQEYEPYFQIFYYYVRDVNSAPFQYVVAHKKELADKYQKLGSGLNDRLLRDWINTAHTYFKKDGAGQATLDEAGLNSYIAQMKQAKVAEAGLIGELVRLNNDGTKNQWDSFVKRGDKLLASGTILGSDYNLLQWAEWMNKSCENTKLREKAAKWCDKACADIIKKDEEAKKNLPPGAIPAISMVDYKSKLMQVAEKLRKPMEEKK